MLKILLHSLVALLFILSVQFSQAEVFGQKLESGEGELLEGEVVEVCQSKGCWMKVKTANDERMVRFKDYGFFVPKTLKGQKVKMRAVGVDKFVSVKEQKHLLEDAGASKEEIAKVTKAINRPEWLASGVEIVGTASVKK